MKTLPLPFISRLALAIISIIGIGYLVKLGQSILAPFFLALLLALLFLPFSNFLEKKLRFPRSLSTMFSLLILLSSIYLLFFFFGTQLSSFSKDLPHLEKQFITVFNDLQRWISRTFDVNTNEQFKYLNEALNKLLSSSGIILGFTLSIFSSGLGFMFFCLLFFIFILNYRRILNRFIVNVFDEKHKGKVEDIVSEIQNMTKKYIMGLIIQIFIVSIITSTVLSILGVKYAVLIGVLTGVLNVIPYLGIVISMLIACFISFATGSTSTTVYVFLAYIGIHAIDGNLILPFVVGSKVKINALFSFIGIIIGEQFWGISGMFLCIPALAIIKIIFERVEGLHPWGTLLGEEDKPTKKKRRVKISETITLEEKD